MTEPPSVSTSDSAVAISVDNPSTTVAASISSFSGGKRSATAAFHSDLEGDLLDSATTLDDVLVSPQGKRTKLLDEELPDVDDNEEFPQQVDDLDAEFALGLKHDESGQALDDDDGLILAREELNREHDDLRIDGKDQDVSEKVLIEEDAGDSEGLTSQTNEIDIVDVDEENEAAPLEEEYSDQEEDEDEEEEDEDSARAVRRAQNQQEARALLQQLNDSARSKLCLMALEKYGKELLYGHEEARDAILVDACAQDSVLSLMRDAIKVRDLYLRGSSAAAPVELDGDDETGGYEDDDEEDEEEDEDDEENEEVVVISEEDEVADSIVPNMTASDDNETEAETHVGANEARPDHDTVQNEATDAARRSIDSASEDTAP